MNTTFMSCFRLNLKFKIRINMKARLKHFVYLISFSVVSFLAAGCTTANDPVVNNTIKTNGSLAVKVTTSTYNGQYAPRHVIAIWVESSSGTFVKTLLVNAAARRQDLTSWLNSSSNGNTTDAITGATMNSHTAVSCTWNGTNTSGSVVGDGTYKLRVEYTESNGSGKTASFTFNKGAIADSQTPSASSGITVNTLKWTPN